MINNTNNIVNIEMHLKLNLFLVLYLKGNFKDENGIRSKKNCIVNFNEEHLLSFYFQFFIIFKC